MSAEPLALQPPVSNNLGEKVDSIKTTIHERLDRVRAFFKPNEQEARELLERVAMRIEDRERKDRARGIYGPSEGDLDPEVLDKMDTLYGVHINLAQHEFSRAEHSNLVGIDNEPYGEISKFQKLIYLASAVSVASGLAGSYIERTDGLARDTITTLAGPHNDHLAAQGGPDSVQTIATYDLSLAVPSENGGTKIDIDIIHPGACDATLYEFDGTQWQALGHLSTDADVLRLTNVPQQNMALGSDNCIPDAESPLRLAQFDDTVAIHMATLIAANEYVTNDPNNVREAREYKGGQGIRIAVVDTSFPEAISNQVADFAGSDVTTDDSGNENIDPADSIHGIVVAGMVAGQATGVAPQASLTLVGFGEGAGKTLSNGSPSVSPEVFFGALDRAVDSSDVVVASLSMYGEGDEAQIKALFEKASTLGKFIVLSAGNNIDMDYAPMQALGMDEAYPNVIVVGGINLAGKITTKEGEINANDGGGALFPIYSSGYRPDEGNVYDAVQYVNDNYRRLDTDNGGSSCAAPVVAGTIALLLGVDPSLRERPEDVHRILQETSGEFGIDAHAALSQATREKLGRSLSNMAKKS